MVSKCCSSETQVELKNTASSEKDARTYVSLALELPVHCVLIIVANEHCLLSTLNPSTIQPSNTGTPIGYDSRERKVQNRDELKSDLHLDTAIRLAQ